jgi:hypothetical protein
VLSLGQNVGVVAFFTTARPSGRRAVANAAYPWIKKFACIDEAVCPAYTSTLGGSVASGVDARSMSISQSSFVLPPRLVPWPGDETIATPTGISSSMSTCGRGSLQVGIAARVHRDQVGGLAERDGRGLPGVADLQQVVGEGLRSQGLRRPPGRGV